MARKEIVVVTLALFLLGVAMVASNFGEDITGNTFRGRGTVKLTVLNLENDHPIRDARIHVKKVADTRRSYYTGRTRRDGTSTIKIDGGLYNIEISRNRFITKSKQVNVVNDKTIEVTFYLTPKTYEPKCNDGTLYSSCSQSQPLFCDDGTLKSKCNLCACPQGLRCTFDGTCN